MKVSGMNTQECRKISYLHYMTLQSVCIATGDTHFQAVVLNIWDTEICFIFIIVKWTTTELQP